MTDQRDYKGSIIPALFYDDAAAALVWLETAFGFETRLCITDESGKVMHSEMSFADGRIMVGPTGWSDWAKSPKSLGGANSANLHVGVDDVDAHCAHARASGAVIVQEPADQFYGDRTYRARDPEGHYWTFGQHRRDVSVAEMEAATQLKVEYK
ncbi:MAG: glyoxalase [Rhodospirillales bacterium]|nr:glyoxalase [Rhodospirillales bacterium]